MEELNQSNEESIKVSYETAENFEQLFEMIKGVKLGDEKSTEDLIMMIEDVRAGERSIEDVPETFDLRDTVKKLMERDTKQS